MTEESELLARLKNGDRSAYAELVEQHSPHIYNLALRMMQNPDEAEEILQETFMQATRHIGNFRGQAKLSTWLYRIASNQALMRLRRNRPESISLDDSDEIAMESFLPLADWTTRPESELLNNEARTMMRNAIDQLPENLRVVFLLRDIEGLSTAETANTLELSIPAVKSRLLRARLNLRNQLSDYFGERLANQEAV